MKMSPDNEPVNVFCKDGNEIVAKGHVNNGMGILFQDDEQFLVNSSLKITKISPDIKPVYVYYRDAHEVVVGKKLGTCSLCLPFRPLRPIYANPFSQGNCPFHKIPVYVCMIDYHDE